jgi:hypothetical protein
MSSHQNDFIAFGNIPVDAYAIIYRRIYLINNTVNAGTGSAGSSCGLRFDFKGPADNIVAKNNIVTGFGVGFGGGAVYIDGTHCSSLTHLTLQDNLYYGNGTNGTIVAPGVTPSYDANSGNVTGNPNFASSSDFHLTAASTLAINTGVATGLNFMTTDYDGATLGNPPEIGCYEYGSTVAVPPPTVAAPVYQNSAVGSTTPAVLELAYDVNLSSTIIPAVTSYAILVNGAARAVSVVGIYLNKVLLTLSSAVKYGDVVTVSYTKPATSPLQTTTGGFAASIVGKVVTNNLAAPTKDASSVTIAMTISPNHVHRTMNVALVYTGTADQITALTAETIRVSDTSGKIYLEKVIVSGVTTLKIPVNLASGVYTVTLLANTIQMASQKMIVY